MKTIIYSARKNDFLQNIFFYSLLRYGKDSGRDISFLEEGLSDIINCNVFVHTEELNANIILKLKNNGCKIYGFDINDASHFCFTINEIKEIEMIDFIYKISGIQHTRTTPEISIDNELNYNIVQKKFEGDVCSVIGFIPSSVGNVSYFENFRSSGKLMSLPYLLWESSDVDRCIRPYEKRVKKCLVRGGNHFLRVHLLLNLMKKDLVDKNSGLHVSIYRNNFCQYCKDVLSRGNFLYGNYKNLEFDCANIIKWQNELLPDNFFNVNHAFWNNKCFAMYYWLIERFIDKYGPLDMGLIETIFNNPYLPAFDLALLTGRYLMYGDFKWIFSIYAPPFWEAARLRTINLLPERTNDQSYFPDIRTDDHYITFKEDFSDLDKLNDIPKEQYEHITNNCYDLYHKWIKWSSEYKMSIALMDEIFNKVV